MKKIFLLSGFIFFFCFANCFSQSELELKEKQQEMQTIRCGTKNEFLGKENFQKVKTLFQRAYDVFPSIPRGMLEAVSYYYTRFVHIAYDAEDVENQEDIPRVYGLMGLTLDGKGVFRENLSYVSRLSKVPPEDIISSPEQNVLAYAAAFAHLQREKKITSSRVEDYAPILEELSELPLLATPDGRGFAMNSFLYSVYAFLASQEWCRQFDVPCREVDMKRLFGKELELLQSAKVFMPVAEPTGGEGEKVSGRAKILSAGEADYENALWVPAGSCNYTPMSGRNVSAVTIHYTSGTYSGAIAWFQNCSYNGVGARASAHYVIRSFDGQITQMVREKDKAWHVGAANAYTIGIEHEAYGNVAEYFTPAMYQASADLLRDICHRNQIDPHRMFYRDTLDDGTQLNKGLHSLGSSTACTKIRGHQHYPDQTHTDPGPYWNWNYYYKLVNETDEVVVLTADSGVLTDSGGPEANYQNDERTLFVIEVPDADSVVLEFSDFELEKDYDFLWIYDGNSEFSPSLGRWNTQSPGRVVSSGNALTLEFRSDCGTTKRGWQAAWHAKFPIQTSDTAAPTFPAPMTEIVWNDSTWLVRDTSVHFVDEAAAGISQRFYQVMEYDGSKWTADGQNGFLCNNFDASSSLVGWNSHAGQWEVLDAQLQQDDAEALQTMISVPLNGTKSDAYLYDFYAKVTAAPEQASSFVTWFAVDNAAEMRNGYALKIVPNEHEMVIGKLTEGVFSILATCSNVYTSANQSYRYRIVHDRQTGVMKVFRHSALLCVVQDQQPVAAAAHFVWQTERCAAAFDNLRVYRSRDDEVLLRVGRARGNDLRYQAAAGMACAKLKSIILDAADAFSPLVEKKLLVDYTPPTPPLHLKVQPDVTLTVGTVSQDFMATWAPVTENESGLETYEVCLEPVRVPDNSSGLVWQEMGTEAYYQNSIGLLSNVHYRLWVRARDEAGWYSPAVSSPEFSVSRNPMEGQVLQEQQRQGVRKLKTMASAAGGTPSSDEGGCLKAYPNPAVENIFLKGVPPAAEMLLCDAVGHVLKRFVLPPDQSFSVADLSPGFYFLISSFGKISFVKV